jgi:predicted ribonuclease YlaK
MAFTYLGLLVAYSVVGANPVAVAGLLGAAGSGESILALAHGVSVHPNALSVVVT